MPRPTFLLPALAVALAIPGCADRAGTGAAAPVVGGLAHAELSPRVRGLVLLGELGCTACHREAPGDSEVDLREGPDLSAVGRRLRPGYLARFVADPIGTEPGTPMPDLLRGQADGERDADVLSHYLRSRAVTASPSARDADAAARGRTLFHGVGCVACHAPRGDDGAELDLPGSVPLGDVAAKYSIESLQAFLLAPHEARPARRMPDFGFSPQEAFDLANYLVADAPPSAATAIDAAKVAAGRARFGELGCANCHALPDAARARSDAARPLAALDPARGCLSDDVGPWPFYALAAQQRADLRAALAALARPLDDEARVRQRLAARNCTACHERGELGGVSDARSKWFTTSDPSIGREGRLPPPLTGVGAKLQRDWLADAIAHGQAIRPALDTRMPGFGRGCGDDLADLLARTDPLPPVKVSPLPEDREAKKAVIELGRELVGDRGMNCIACHLWAGKRVGSMAALDLVDSTGQRLRPQWFASFLRDPFAFKPITLMPQFYPDGRTTRPELGDGDTQRQIDAMWHYLAEGRNVRQPSGLRRPPIELEVGDEAVILRRSVQHTGKRGISVGYPGGVNITFDAERLGMNQIWWGKFLDAGPVWTGQGSGQARILGRRRAALPNGPAFAELPNADAPWPTASRRELGQQWSGYDLDERRRPTFRYECFGVQVADKPVAQTVPGQPPALVRTLQFVSDEARTLYFRAAVDGRIEATGDRELKVGGSLVLMVQSPAEYRIRAAGDQQELVIELAIPAGRSELDIRYRWSEEGR